MGYALKIEGSLETITCGSCGITFAVPEYWLKEKRNTNGKLTCPNGDNRVFVGETQEQRANRLEKEKIELERKLNLERNNRITAEGVARKLKQRAKGGMCPCCKRSFIGLARHIKTKHPDFEKQRGE